MIYIKNNNNKKKKGKERDINSQQERNMIGTWEVPPPFFYLKIIAFVRAQDIGTFETAIVSCYNNILLFS